MPYGVGQVLDPRGQKVQKGTKGTREIRETLDYRAPLVLPEGSMVLAEWSPGWLTQMGR